MIKYLPIILLFLISKGTSASVDWSWSFTSEQPLLAPVDELIQPEFTLTNGINSTSSIFLYGVDFFDSSWPEGSVGTLYDQDRSSSLVGSFESLEILSSTGNFDFEVSPGETVIFSHLLFLQVNTQAGDEFILDPFFYIGLDSVYSFTTTIFSERPSDPLSIEIYSVPLPSAFWLFASVIAAINITRRGTR